MGSTLTPAEIQARLQTMTDVNSSGGPDARTSADYPAQAAQVQARLKAQAQVRGGPDAISGASQLPQTPIPSSVPAPLTGNAEVMDYFIKLGINPTTAAQLAGRINKTAPSTPPISNGIRLDPGGAANLLVTKYGLTPDQASEFLANQAARTPLPEGPTIKMTPRTWVQAPNTDYVHMQVKPPLPEGPTIRMMVQPHERTQVQAPNTNYIHMDVRDPGFGPALAEDQDPAQALHRRVQETLAQSKKLQADFEDFMRERGEGLEVGKAKVKEAKPELDIGPAKVKPVTDNRLADE